mgnify:CR=1 FL=1
MKKGKKNNEFSTPVWVWVVILILLLQIGKLAYRNDWFKADRTIKKELDQEKINKIIKKLKKESSK